MNFKNFVASLKIRQLRKKMEPQEFVFPDAVQNPKHILVCLPDGLRELTLVKQFLPNIAELFKPADIVLLSMPGIKVTDIFPRKGFQIISPSGEQISWSGLAKTAFIKQLKDLKIDVVLDLNLQTSSFTSSILLNFPEALRIGRGNHRGNPFYNLEIKTKYLRDERNIYRTILDTISIMKNQQVA